MMALSENADRNKPRGCAKISIDGESLLKARRAAIAARRIDRHRRHVMRLRDAGDPRDAEHAFKAGEKAMIRYRKEGISSRRRSNPETTSEVIHGRPRTDRKRKTTVVNV